MHRLNCDVTDKITHITQVRNIKSMSALLFQGLLVSPSTAMIYFCRAISLLVLSCFFDLLLKGLKSKLLYRPV